MTITEFCNKYAITGEEKAGFKEAARYWATVNYAEKRLIQIYVTTFGIYPGGIDGDPVWENTGGGIDDSAVALDSTWSSAKLNSILDYAAFEQAFNSGLL